MRRTATNFVTRLMNDGKNHNQLSVCKDLQVKDKNDIRFLYKFKANYVYKMGNVFKATKIRGYSGDKA